MEPWATQLLEGLGFAQPFGYAAATFGMFLWLSNRASEPATESLRKYIRSVPQTTAVANFNLEVFDRIYTKPLFHVRALLRSTIITSVISVLIWLTLRPAPINDLAAIQYYGENLLFNVLADYVSLFFIRRWLSVARSRPMFSLIAATITGVLIVYLSYLVREGFLILYNVIILGNSIMSTIDFAGRWHIFNPLYSLWTPEQASWEKVAYLWPAFVVHLWLPLFGLAAAITKAISLMIRAAEGTQWFAKDGSDNPFQAVGYIAAAIVFVVGVGLQVVNRSGL